MASTVESAQAPQCTRGQRWICKICSIFLPIDSWLISSEPHHVIAFLSHSSLSFFPEESRTDLVRSERVARRRGVCLNDVQVGRYLCTHGKRAADRAFCQAIRTTIEALNERSQMRPQMRPVNFWSSTGEWPAFHEWNQLIVRVWFIINGFLSPACHCVNRESDTSLLIAGSLRFSGRPTAATEFDP